MSEADTAAASQAPATEEQKHDVEYASEETKNAVSIIYKRPAINQCNLRCSKDALLRPTKTENELVPRRAYFLSFPPLRQKSMEERDY